MSLESTIHALWGGFRSRRRKETAAKAGAHSKRAAHKEFDLPSLEIRLARLGDGDVEFRHRYEPGWGMRWMWGRGGDQATTKTVLSLIAPSQGDLVLRAIEGVAPTWRSIAIESSAAINAALTAGHADDATLARHLIRLDLALEAIDQLAELAEAIRAAQDGPA